ncbi:MAG: hypothetical protein ACRD5K_19660 [Candidatus Acidiferrales bacterium]
MWIVYLGIASGVFWFWFGFWLLLIHKKPKRVGWITAFLILLGGAVLYAGSLLVAPASDGTTWDRYIPLFRTGQDIGMLVFALGVLSLVIVALSQCIGWLAKGMSP